MKRGGPLKRGKPLKRTGFKRKPPPKSIAVECETCGRSFERSTRARAAEVTQCRSCRVSGEPVSEKTCPECGDSFTIRPSEKARLYCSRSCYFKNRPPTEEENESRRKKMAGKRKGKKNPNYKTGRYRGKQDRRLSREFTVKKKGEDRCRCCRSPQNLHAHHAVPRSQSRAGRYDLRNCLPLCVVCHSKFHQSADPVVFRDMITREEWEFMSTLIGPTWLDKKYPDRGRPFRDESDRSAGLPIPKEGAV